MVTITLNEYLKTLAPKGNLLAASVQLIVRDDTTGDNLVWDYNLTSVEVSIVDSDAKQIEPILTREGTNAVAAYDKQVAPPTTTVDDTPEDKAAFEFSIDPASRVVAVTKKALISPIDPAEVAVASLKV